MSAETASASQCASADPRRLRILHRMRGRYALRERSVQIGDLQLTVTVVADPDRVLLEMEEGVRAAGRDEPRWQPYWAECWESAVGLGRVIADWPLANRHVLDLGCGVGLAGIVAAARGAQVVMADAAPAALLFVRYNAWPYRDRVDARCLDWQRDRLQRSFDLILGADILYDPTDWPYLDRFFRAHLSAEGRVLLGEPTRRSADNWPDWCRQHGWLLTSTSITVTSPDRTVPVRVHEMRPVSG